MHKHDVLVVGCGLSGVVIAERFATILNKKVLIIDKRDHVGGNCYDYRDAETNILMNKYGAHLFHTNSERVWEYVNKFDKWVRWDHEVYSMVENKLVNIPVNINTVNHLCGQNIKNSVEMDEWLRNNQVVYDKYDVISNSEQMAKSRIGNTLYEKMVKNYTYKQWGKYPHELDASVLARIPLPEKGYTHFIEKILDHPNISVQLNADFFNVLDVATFETVIYTGPIDQYYKDKNLEKLEYRSIDFQVERHFNVKYYQPNSVVNYPEPDVPFTRIVEYKHFLNQQSDHTVIMKEVTTDDGEPYYPVPNEKNLRLYEEYKRHASQEKNVHFLGRLANYKYFNMDTAILNSLEYFDKEFNHHPKICFITAVYGNYEASCKRFEKQTVATDFICFTDNENIIGNGWTIDTTPYHLTHKSQLDDSTFVNSLSNNKHTFNIAKYYKQSFSNVPRLQKYDVIVWLDGTLEITHDKTSEFILSKIHKEKVIGWHHELRHGDLQGEVIASNFYRYTSTFWNNQYQPYQDIVKQYNDYIQDGYTDNFFKQMHPDKKHFGLWITCFVAFLQHDAEVKKLLDLWYLQTLKYTTQDQIGFPYACQKTNLIPYTLPDNDVSGEPHKRTMFYIKHDHGK